MIFSHSLWVSHAQLSLRDARFLFRGPHTIHPRQKLLSNEASN